MTHKPDHGAAGTASSRLAFDKSTIIAWTAISLLVVETFSGALRYYLDQAGLSPLLYLPKVACLLLFALELLAFRGGRLFWLGMLGWLLSALLAMLHGASVQNLAFSLFVISPLLFAMLCSQHLLQRQTLLGRAIALCLLACLLGVLLDKYTQVPWKGYSYSLGDTQLSGNMAWSAEDQDRIAGFSRMSSVLSSLIALYSLFLMLFLRSLLLRLALGTLAIWAIALTTSKAPAAAFALTLGLLLIQRLTWTCRILCVLVVALGLLLPLLGLFQDFDARTVSSGGSSLASLFDRLNNTWPNLFEFIGREGWGYAGAGFGMVGSSISMFPVPGASILAVLDSSSLYLWAMFGVAGVLLYALQAPLFLTLLHDTRPVPRMLLSLGVFWCLVSATTDMFEVAAANLFMGLVIGYVISHNANAVTLKHSPGELSSLPFVALR